MYLIQLLLPLYDSQRQTFPRKYFDEVRHQLAANFGGVTAYLRSPAVGIWKDEEDAEMTRDDVVMIEVMVPELDGAWWANYRRQLEAKFRQDEMLIRALQVTML